MVQAALDSMPQLDPEIWARNRAALASTHPTSASQILNLELPRDVDVTRGRDGHVTFRIPSANGPHWLGHSSMPSVSSPRLMQTFARNNGNVLLASMGHGGEARELLHSRPAHFGVMTWDIDALIPALALRLQDFSHDLEHGRLLIAVGPEPAVALDACFADHPGHLPPVAIFAAPHLSNAALTALQAAVEAAARAQEARLVQRLQDSEARWRGVAAASATTAAACDLAIMSMVPVEQITAVASGLARAAAGEGLSVHMQVADRPGGLHLSSLTAALANAQPRQVVLLDQSPRELGNLLDAVEHTATWCVVPGLRRPEIVASTASGQSLFCVDPAHARELGAGAMTLPVAVDTTCFKPTTLTDEQFAAYGCDVAILMDAAPTSAEALGFKWDSHRTVIAAVLEKLRERPAWLSPTQAANLLEQVTRSIRVPIDTGEARTRFIQTLQARLAPTALALKLMPLVAARGLKLRLWGHGWRQHDAASGVAVVSRCPDAVERNLIYNASGAVLHLNPAATADTGLLEALASGTGVLRPAGVRHDEPDTAEALPDVWAEVPCLEAWDRAVERIERVIQAETEPPARAVVLARHSFAARLWTLLGANRPG